MEKRAARKFPAEASNRSVVKSFVSNQIARGEEVHRGSMWVPWLHLAELTTGSEAEIVDMSSRARKVGVATGRG